MSHFRSLQRRKQPVLPSHTQSAYHSPAHSSAMPLSNPPLQLSGNLPANSKQTAHVDWSFGNIPINHPNQEAVKQQKENSTGLPDHVKSGVEALSGLSLDDVHVHYNSPRPAELQALAYTQGTEIHVGPGQEQHLAHEAWHVVQQKQGRVEPTHRIGKTALNTNTQLEAEADHMGMEATRPSIQLQAAQKSGQTTQKSISTTTTQPLQRKVYNNREDLWGEILDKPFRFEDFANDLGDPILRDVFFEIDLHINKIDVQETPNLGRAAEATTASKGDNPPYILRYKKIDNKTWLLASILHELLHVTTDIYYQNPDPDKDFALNLNIPADLTPGSDEFGEFIGRQVQILEKNLQEAVSIAKSDKTLNIPLTKDQSRDLPSDPKAASLKDFVLARLDNYALPSPHVHYETVIFEVMTYWQLIHKQDPQSIPDPVESPTFRFLRNLLIEANVRRKNNPSKQGLGAISVNEDTPLRDLQHNQPRQQDQ